jgi:uncharacterized protein YndB with AHSA1/START domain
MTMDGNYDLTVSRVIKAPRSAVWKAWNDPEQLVKWWAPAPFTTVSTKHEFYPGGGFGSIMRTEDGKEFYKGEACFLEVKENERIIWTSALRSGWRPNKDKMPFTAIITMEDHPEGTKYTAIVLHDNDDDRQEHANMGFVDGWGTCIEQLGKLAETLA